MRQAPHDPAPPARVYRAPALVCFGELRALTLGGSPGAGDSGSGFPPQRMNI